MSKICHICKTEMEKKNTTINTGWGQYKLIVEGINSYVCPKCSEVVLEGQDAMMLQKLSRSLAEVEDEQKPDILNLSEVADLLRVTNQTIYNMIKDGRIKAKKFGREWRFTRKDIEDLISGVTNLSSGGKTSDSNKKDSDILSKYL